MFRKQSKILGLFLSLFLVAATWGGPDAPVADAAERGDLDAVRALVRDGADVNAAQGDGMTALHWAALNGNADMIEVLGYAGAHPEVTTRLGGYTPLHLASHRGNDAAVDALVAAGADVRAVTSTGVTPLHLAAESGNPDLVQRLIDAGADVDVRDTSMQRTPLMFATAKGELDAMRVLVAAGADISAATRVVDYVAKSEEDMKERRQRARMMAVRRGEDPPPSNAPVGPYAQNQQAQAGEPKDTAAAAETTEPEQDPPPVTDPDRPTQPVVGAEPAGADTAQAGPRPLGYSDLVGKQGGMTALHYAARDGRRDEAIFLLESGADLNAVTEGDHSTALLISVINGHYDLALELLERGADPNLYSEDGAGPLFNAVQSRWAHRTWYPQPTAWRQQQASHLDLMEALLAAGADPNARLETHLWYVAYNAGRIGVDFAGATPFWRAAYSLDVEGMRLLLAHGADPEIPTTKPASRRRSFDPDDEDESEEDPSGLPPVPDGGPAVYPIHAATGVGYGTSRVGQQHVFAPTGWLAAVKFLVEEAGADVNARDHDGYSPMHHAAARGDNEVLQYLHDKGADATLISRRGQTTVDMANGPQQRVQPFPETMALLMGWGAENNDNCQSCE
ncbi:MAG: ankyrin repeat domain-containing protein [Longimicrobiales bacterium]